MSEKNCMIFYSGDLRKETQETKGKSAKTAAKELLKNGILVETKKGLICMSLRDALTKGVGGQNLSIKDFQTVATTLLFQQQTPPPCPPVTVTDTVTNPKKGHRVIKRTKMNSNKTPIVSLVSDNLTSQVDVELNSLPPVEYSLVKERENKAEEISGIINKKPFVNRRSLIIKNNLMPVISVGNKTEIRSLGSVLVSSGQRENESYVSCEETSDNSEVVADQVENKLVKKRGGWPKGRKRKPEVKYEVRPPKAPATGYVIFLNEKRKDYRDMPFTEVTKLLGNEWSKLSLQEKKIYLDQAEVEKKRYREELKAYRQSDAYKSYLDKKRLKRLQGHGTEESDMDATDEIDEEDNEELYCRSCDQWFHSLHNKKEHLYGRQHLQSIAGRYTKPTDPDWCNANMSSTSLDESSLDGSSYLKGSKDHCCNESKDSLNMDDVIVRFMLANKEREEERKILQKKLEESKTKNQILSQELQKLNKTVDSLTCLMESERTAQILLEQRLFNLLNVPTLFYLPEPISEDN